MIHSIHKTVKPSYLEKLQIIQNINKLFFLYPFRLGETDFQKILPGVLSSGTETWEKCIDSAHFRGMWTPQIEKFFPQKSDKIPQAFWRYKTLKSLKKYEIMYPWG